MAEDPQFHVPEGTYLLSHSVGCLPTGAKAALDDHYLNPWQDTGGGAWPKWLGTINSFCSEIAVILNARPRDICPQPSVSAAFSNYLSSLPEGNRNKVVMHADAFPTMGFVVQAMAQRGLELVLIEAGKPANDPAIWVDQITEDTLAVVITHVHSNTGVISPVAEIADACRKNGAVSVVDVAQSIGIVPIDVTSWRTDAIVGSCVKWLCGGPGAGYLWVSPEQVSELSPEHIGWFSHSDPFEFDIRSFNYAEDAKRFWGGTPSIAPYAIALGSIQAVLGIGLETIGAHNLALKNAAIAGLDHDKWLPAVPDELGGTLCLTFGADTAQQIAHTLKESGCHFDQRGSTLRLSFHIYNSFSDAEIVRAALASAP